MDGKRAAVPKGASTYTFPFSPEKLVLRTWKPEVLDRLITTESTPYIYYKAIFHVGNGTTMKFMVLSSVKIEEAMEKLMTFYSPPNGFEELEKKMTK